MEAAAAGMAGTSGGNAGGGGDEKKAAAVASACDVEALRKCLEENRGDRLKCQVHIDAFRSSCSASPIAASGSGRRSSEHAQRKEA